jgi:hypothetical protein
MNRTRLFTLLGLASLALPVFHPISAQTGKVLLMAKEGESADLDYMLTHEVGVMSKMLEEAGFEVMVASPSGQSLTGDEQTLSPDLRLADVEEWIPTVPEFEGLEYGGNGVVEEGNVITSGACPYAARALEIEDTTPALPKAFIARLKGM